MSNNIDRTAGLAAIAEIREQFNIEKERNIAFAEFDCDGKTEEFIAASGKESPAGTVQAPNQRQFETFETPSGHIRAFDAEVKLLEKCASQLNADSHGTIQLFSEFTICDSCEEVIVQFELAFPNVKVMATHG